MKYLILLYLLISFQSIEHPLRQGQQYIAKRVVIMDNPDHKQKETPYLQSMKTALGGIQNATITIQPTTQAWQGEDSIWKVNPDLIIIHVNCFSIEEDAGKGRIKFNAFIKKMTDRDTKFLFYSGGFSAEKDEGTLYYVRILRRATGLPLERINTFAIHPDDGLRFPDSIIVKNFRNKVIQVLK